MLFFGVGHGSPVSLICLKSSIASCNLPIAFLESAIARSRSDIFCVDFLSRFDIITDMNEPSEFYLKAVEVAKQELVGLVALQERTEEKKIAVRKTIQHLGAVLETEGLQNPPGAEALCLFENQSLPDEIRNLLKVNYPARMTPNSVRNDLRLMGRDMSSYPNPQSAIQMALKRMVESDSDPTEEQEMNGRKAYRCPKTSRQLSEVFGFGPSIAGREAAKILKRLVSETGK